MKKLLVIGIYARVSTEEQAKKGYSLEHQIEKCKEHAYRDNPDTDIQFMLYVDDGFSGEYMERPNLTKLREDVSSRLINEVYCYDPDRLSRNLMHQLLIDEAIAKNSRLIFVNGEYEKTPEGILFFQLRGAIAQFEKAKINERMSNGRISKAKRGKVVKDYKVYGYNYNRDLGQMEVNEAEATIVRFIFDAFIGKLSEFKGINGIALYLTEKEIPTKKGLGSWHRQVVRQIIMNRAYIGEFYQNKWNTEGSLGNQYKTKTEDKVHPTERPKEDWILVPCPVIIELAQFDHAQKLLQVARQRWAGFGKHDYLLSGLLRCETCGNTMTGRQQTNWGKKVYEYTDVKNTAGFKTKGCGRHLKCEKLDDYVWGQVYGYLMKAKESSPTDVELNAPSFEINEKIRLNKLLIETEQGRKQFIKAIISGKLSGLSEGEQNEALMDSQKKIEKIKLQIEEQDSSLKQRELQKGKANLFQESIEGFFNEGTTEIAIEDKKKLIRMMVREIHLGDNELVDIYLF